MPPSLTGDEAANLTDITRILHGGYLPFYFEANNGREPLYIYMQVPLVWLLGAKPYALRLTSALIGVVTVALTYRLAKDMFGRMEHVPATWAPLVASLLLAASFWHITLSRIGLRAISLPMLAVLTFILFWRGYSRGKQVYYLAAGAVLGLSLYTYIASRLLPLVLALFCLGVLLRSGRSTRFGLRGMALMAAGLIVLATPLALYAIGHPLLFWGRVAAVSTLDVKDASVQSTWESVARTLEMFVWQGNYEDTTFDPGARPVFAWPAGAAFLIGICLAFAAILLRRRDRSSPAWTALLRPEVGLFSLLWLILMIVPSFFSYPAPHFLRTAGAIPVTYLFPALACTAAAVKLQSVTQRNRRRLGQVALTLLVIGSAAYDLSDYSRLATSDWYYYELDSDIYEAGLYIARTARSSDVAVYGDYKLMRYGTVRALTQGLPAYSFDDGWSVVFPAGPVEYLLLARDPVAPGFGRYLPPETQRFSLKDNRGKVTAIGYRVDGREAQAYSRTVPSTPLFQASHRPNDPPDISEASLSGQFALRGYGVVAGAGNDLVPATSVTPGQAVRVILTWEALSKPATSYHVSIKAFDSSGKAWGQVDSPPGHGGYPTTRWHPGDVIYDFYELKLDPATPPGRYRLEVTVYDGATNRVLPIVSPEGGVLAQHYILGDVQVGKGEP